MKKFLRYFGKTVKWIFIVFLLYLASLFFRDQKIPRFCLDWAARRVSSAGFDISCESAAVGFRHGVTVTDFEVRDLLRPNRLEPILSVKSVNVNWFSRTVRIVGARYPRLPDSYYSPECHERNEPLDIRLPKVRAFRLVLERPDILGVRPARVTGEVRMRPRFATFDNLHLDWYPQPGRRTSLDGAWKVDLDAQKVTGEVHGFATQPQIRPLLVALDITSSLPYMDAFTGIVEPIAATSDYTIDLVKGDFGMNLTLTPKAPVYRGVPFSGAEGTLHIQTGTRGTNCNVKVGVDVASATDTEGRPLSGSLAVTRTNGVARLAFDVRSALAFADALKLTEFLTPEDLAPIVCHTPPNLTVKGTVGTSAEDKSHNDLAFTAELARGAFLGFELSDVKARFALQGDTIAFTEATGTGRTGGRVSAPGWMKIPDFDGDKAEFGVKVDYRGGSLEELADFFKFDLGERHGRVDGWCDLTAPAGTNFAERLNAKGSVTVSDGHLAQMKMFAGLTSLMAEKVPGVAFLVNQSQASADFTITNGVLHTENLYIEGGLVSLKGWGDYDIAHDRLDFTVRVQFMKKESLMGKILHPVTLPFTKLLLEFKATGPLDAAEWKYISLIDRIL